MIAGRSFSVLAEVAVDSADVQGVLLKQGAGHGGYVLFVADGRLQFVYNFFGEEEQRVVAPDPLPTGEHILGVGYLRTGVVEGTHTPVGEATLDVDGEAVASLAGVKAHPFTFGLAGGGVSVGRNLGQPVSTAYVAPFAFTGGAIRRVVVDVSGTPYRDAEHELAAAFARD
jgi:arylsulfatase